jgi:hypothetical protein
LTDFFFIFSSKRIDRFFFAIFRRRATELLLQTEDTTVLFRKTLSFQLVKNGEDEKLDHFGLWETNKTSRSDSLDNFRSQSGLPDFSWFKHTKTGKI